MIYATAIALAFFLAIIQRICLMSFRANIYPNPKYQVYLKRLDSQMPNLKEEPEPYLFSENAFIKDFSLGKDVVVKAIYSWEFLLIFLIYGFGFILSFLRLAQPLNIIIHIIVLESLVSISIVDVQYGLIPDSLQLFMLFMALLSLVVSPSPVLHMRLLGALTAGGFLFVLAMLGGMGGGDVKLMTIAGFWLGVYPILLALFIGILLGAFVGVILIISKKKTRKDQIAFGPYLSIGIYMSALFYTDIIHFLYF